MSCPRPQITYLKVHARLWRGLIRASHCAVARTQASAPELSRYCALDGSLQPGVVACIAFDIHTSKYKSARVTELCDTPVNRKLMLPELYAKLGPRAFKGSTDFGMDSEDELSREQKTMLCTWSSFVRHQLHTWTGGDTMTVVGVCHGGANRSGLFAGWAKRAIEGEVDEADACMPQNDYYRAVVLEGLDVDPVDVKQRARKRRREVASLAALAHKQRAASE